MSLCRLQYWNLCIFVFLCKFGCYGNSLCSLKIFVSIFEFADPKTPTIHASIVSISCTELKSVPFWFIFCLILVSMATPLAPLKIQVVYFNSPILYTLPYMRKIPWFFHRIEICAILAYFGLNLPLLKFHIAYLNLTTPKTYYSCEKVLDFFAQNWNWCIFCV